MKDKIDSLKKDLIIEKAREHFESVGYEKTQVAAIAKDLGIGISTIYKLFDSKEGLFNAYLTSLVDELYEENLKKLEMYDSPYDRLHKLLEFKFEYFESKKLFIKDYLVYAPFIMCKTQKLQEAPIYKWFNLIAELIKDCALTNKFVTDDYMQLAYNLDYLSDGYTMYWAEHDTEYELKSKVDELMNVFFSGVLAKN